MSAILSSVALAAASGGLAFAVVHALLSRARRNDESNQQAFEREVHEALDQIGEGTVDHVVAFMDLDPHAHGAVAHAIDQLRLKNRATRTNDSEPAWWAAVR